MQQFVWRKKKPAAIQGLTARTKNPYNHNTDTQQQRNPSRVARPRADVYVCMSVCLCVCLFVYRLERERQAFPGK